PAGLGQHHHRVEAVVVAGDLLPYRLAVRAEVHVVLGHPDHAGGGPAGGDEVERGAGGDQDAVAQRADVLDDRAFHALGEVAGGELARGHDLAARPPPDLAGQGVGLDRLALIDQGPDLDARIDVELRAGPPPDHADDLHVVARRRHRVRLVDHGANGPAHAVGVQQHVPDLHVLRLRGTSHPGGVAGPPLYAQ